MPVTVTKCYSPGTPYYIFVSNDIRGNIRMLEIISKFKVKRSVLLFSKEAPKKQTNLVLNWTYSIVFKIFCVHKILDSLIQISNDIKNRSSHPIHGV